LPEASTSSIQIIGNTLGIQLYDISPTSDGGYLVTTGNFKGGFDKLVLYRYSPDFKLIWEKQFGGNESYEYNPKVFIDENDDIILTSVTHGFGQDSVPLTSSKSYGIYVAYVNNNGTTKWEKAVYYSEQNSDGLGPFISDIIKDKDGNILICSNAIYGETRAYDLTGMLIKISPSGKVLSSFAVSGNRQFQAVFESDDKYTCFWDNDRIYGFMQFNKSDTGGLNKYTVRTQQLKLSTSSTKSPLLKGQTDISVQYLWNNSECHRLQYNNSSNTFEVIDLTNSKKTFQTIDKSYDNHFLGIQNNSLFELDRDLNEVHTFSNEKLQADSNTIQTQTICKLYNGNFVMGYQQKQSIYLFHFNAEGHLISNE